MTESARTANNAAARNVVLEVRDLSVTFQVSDKDLRVVDDVAFDLHEREVLALVGESGSGKTVTALTLLGLTRHKNTRHGGTVAYRGMDLLMARDDDLRKIRGAEISMIFQDPLTSLNPVQRVGAQIVEMLRLHTSLSRRESEQETFRLLREVGLPSPEENASSYPHEFSGGMRQRAMIAMALSCNPKILIADEPTTALDVTIQADILDLLRRMAAEHDTAVILITHDLGVVAELADTVAVMYAGRIVEAGPVRDVFQDPMHPYTWGLLNSVPRRDRPRRPRLRTIEGSPPSLDALPSGCRFRTRCRYAHDACTTRPALQAHTDRQEHLDACWLTVDVKRATRARDAVVDPDG